ncbi:hypothetical protein [Alteromonas sp. M12]|uniref:hypothetical protein n=1 Tax=Alteromonas sp. M12 TaxID=3135644 RepID=UPI00319DF66D
MTNLNKARKYEDKWNSKSISGGLVDSFKFTDQQTINLSKIVKFDCADRLIKQTEKIIEAKLANDDIPRINRASETKKSLELVNGHLLNAMKYLNELDPLSAEALPVHIFLAEKNEHGYADQQLLNESPLRNLTVLIAGIEKSMSTLTGYARKDEISFLIVEVAKIFRSHGLKAAYTPESKFHRFLIECLASIGIEKKNISDKIKELLDQG